HHFGGVEVLHATARPVHGYSRPAGWSVAVDHPSGTPATDRVSSLKVDGVHRVRALHRHTTSRRALHRTPRFGFAWHASTVSACSSSWRTSHRTTRPVTRVPT